MDGGPSARDGGRRADGGRDAGTDGGRDGGPEDPDWETLLTEGECIVQRARHPEALLTVEWEPCRDFGQCEQMKGELWPLTDTVTSTVLRDGRLVMSLQVLGTRHGPMTVFASDDGRVLGAYRTPVDVGVCNVSRVAVTLEHIAVGFSTRFDGLPTTMQFVWSTHEALASSPVMLRLDGALLSDVDALYDLAVSSSRLGVRIYAGVGILAADPAGRHARVGGLLPGWNDVEDLQVVGDAALWTQFPGPTYIARGLLGEEPHVYYDPPEGEVLLLREYDGQLTFFVVYDHTGPSMFSRVEVWTGRYTPDPADFAPRLVTEVEGIGLPCAGPGVYAYVHNALHVVDLETGKSRTFRPPGIPGTDWRMAVLTATHDQAFVSYRYRPRRFDLTHLPWE